MKYTYAVIVSVSEEGNAADNLAVPDKSGVLSMMQGALKRYSNSFMGGSAVGVRSPIFHVGEILVLDSEYGREVAGCGRKPSKWDVGVEYFDNIERAIERAIEVTRKEMAC